MKNMKLATFYIGFSGLRLTYLQHGHDAIDIPWKTACHANAQAERVELNFPEPHWKSG